MTTPDFEFLIEDACPISGRGVVVFGHWCGSSIRYGRPRLPAHRHTGTEVLPIDQVDLECARVAGGHERPALLLRGLTIGQVSAGSVVRSHP
jgi:hypothetical protein